MTYQYPEERQKTIEQFFALEDLSISEMLMGMQVSFLHLPAEDVSILTGVIYDWFQTSEHMFFKIMSNGSSFSAKTNHIRKPASKEQD